MRYSESITAKASSCSQSASGNAWIGILIYRIKLDSNTNVSNIFVNVGSLATDYGTFKSIESRKTANWPNGAIFLFEGRNFGASSVTDGHSSYLRDGVPLGTFPQGYSLWWADAFPSSCSVRTDYFNGNFKHQNGRWELVLASEYWPGISIVCSGRSAQFKFADASE